METWIIILIMAALLSVACAVMPFCAGEGSLFDRFMNSGIDVEWNEANAAEKFEILWKNCAAALWGVFFFLGAIILAPLLCVYVCFLCLWPVTPMYKKKKIREAEEMAASGGSFILDNEIKKEYSKAHPNRFRDMTHESERITKREIVLLSCNIPFRPDIKQIIFIDNGPVPAIDRYLREYENEIREFCKENLRDFVFLPTLKDRLSGIASLDSLTPFGIESEVNLDPFKSSMLNEFFVEGPANGLAPGFLRFRNTYCGRDCVIEEDEGRKAYQAIFQPLLPEHVCSFERQINDFVLSSDGYGDYCIEYEGKCDADFWFNEEDAALIDEIKERVTKLRLHGIEEAVISSLFKVEEKLSRLVVTKDFRIVLPDYDNMEIEMKALPKAVYILFLRHPEGIMFKKLSDHYQELFRIYNKLSNRLDLTAITRSVTELADPTTNSINEKCARIRRAFIDKFSDPLARHYCITGQRGEPKRITLPQELITFEAEI